MRLIADFEIVVGDERVELSMTYPSFFPDTPPAVRPRQEVRLSQHQYGAGGELCLEFRPDNWEPSMTGAMMIESAHRLFSGEHGADGGGRVEDAHRTTLAQDVRSSKTRFMLSPEARARLAEVEPGCVLPIKVVEQYYGKHLLTHLIGIGDDWTAPNPLQKTPTGGWVVRLNAGSVLPVTSDIDVMRGYLTVTGAEAIADMLSPPRDVHFLVLADNGVALSEIYVTDAPALVTYETVDLPFDERRLPESYSSLAEKTVAIVGCGSVGSKIAASLARSGVRNFFLLDADILLPGNLVRNELDWRAVGLHKADGVKARILEMNPIAEINVQRILIGGQEASGGVDLAMKRLAQASIIVDATADAHVFNIFGGLAGRERVPYVWAEVFAGGIGGLVVRCRPDLEPIPYIARRQIAAWCDEQGVSAPEGKARNYATTPGSGPTLVADDSDVTVLAAHAARLVLDTLLRPTESIYPQSAYAIGLATGWLFSQPFDTWPIPLVLQGTWGPDQDEDVTEQLTAFIEEVMPKATDAG